MKNELAKGEEKLNINQYSSWMFNYNFLNPVGEEMKDPHPLIIQSSNEMIREMKYFAYLPTSDTINRYNREKPLLIALKLIKAMEVLQKIVLQNVFKWIRWMWVVSTQKRKITKSLKLFPTFDFSTRLQV